MSDNASNARKERRWLKSVIAASAEPLPSFPWMRTNRRKPASLQAETLDTQTPVQPRRVTIAAR